MIDANAAIFSAIDSAVSEGGQHLQNSGAPRWIKTITAEQSFLKDARVLQRVNIGHLRSILHFDHDGYSHFSTIGFSPAFEMLSLTEMDVNSSHLTTILFEAGTRPSASALKIVQNVGAQDRLSDPQYSGHDMSLIAELFPSVRIFKDVSGLVADHWQAFFMLCIEESSATGSWISADLRNSLKTMSELDSSKIPYAVLCRSIFDYDKTSLFLALYRCIEALYSYTSTVKLMGSLGITSDWKEVSKRLELDLRWYPKEDNALEGLFRKVGDKELVDIQEALSVPRDPKETLASRAARSIYDIRNKVVHYRPLHQGADLEAIDWNRLCSAMSCVVLDVYNEAS